MHRDSNPNKCMLNDLYQCPANRHSREILKENLAGN